MPSEDIPNQYHLIGEYVPMWLIMGLLLFGVVGSVISALLWLTPELKMERLKPLAIQSNSNERPPIPPPLAIDTTELPMAGTPQKPTTEKIEPIPDPLQSESQSPQKDTEENIQASTSPSTDISGRSMATVSPDARIEQEMVVVDGPPIVEEHKKDARKLTSLSPDTATASTPHARIEPTVDQARDCPPLFTVSFSRSSIRPIDLDLNAKATRLREWLNLHPETIVLIEGYTDSSGPEELNLLISHRRSKVVSELLAKTGIANHQMVTRAFGENALLAEHPTESGKNRRVSLRVEGVRACRESTGDGEVR